jgi:ATP-dependent Clp protease ATP-binding subunit ClpA
MIHPKRERLLNLTAVLQESIRGQEHVIPSVVERVTIGETGLATIGRPKGSFFFIGPTGVGKTELARALSRQLFDQEPHRFDMAEFAAADAIKNFIGDQSGSLGRLGTVLSRHHDGVLLFDEIEKAHGDVVNVFLSVLDAARVTCGTGETFDLSGFYVVFSSNLGALDILRARHLNFTQIEKHVLAQVASACRPEFLGRIDSKLVFHKLSYEVQLEIALLNMERERRFLQERGHQVVFAEDVLSFLIQVGFDRYLGARPLTKAMEKYIRVPLARERITNPLLETLSGVLKVGATRNELVFVSTSEANRNVLS